MHRLEAELRARLQVLRLNVDESVGQRARAVYGVEKVPAAILLDRQGSEVYRTEGKLPRTGQIRDKLRELESIA